MELKLRPTAPVLLLRATTLIGQGSLVVLAMRLNIGIHLVVVGKSMYAFDVAAQ